MILARSIVSKPKLLAIEGFSQQLQKQDREKIFDFITSKDVPWTLAIITDDPALASRCDRVIIMKKGEIIESGTYDMISKSPHFNNVFKREF